jgi:hypothetical protein
MPLIRSTASEYCTYVVALILLLGEIMPTYSCYAVKGLIYIVIAVLFS